MKKAHASSRLLLASLLAAGLLAGCGGDGDGATFSGGNTPGGGGGGTTPPVTSPDISVSVADLLAYLNQLIAGTSDSSDPVDINPLTLATDDTMEPSPVN